MRLSPSSGTLGGFSPENKGEHNVFEATGFNVILVKQSFSDKVKSLSE
ncbi:hypothetical protein [Caldifermentibacillus hisashii]